MTETLEMALPLRPTHEFYTSALPPSSNEGAEEFAPRRNTVHSQRRHHGRVNELHQLGRLIRQVVVAPDLCQLRRVRQEATAEGTVKRGRDEEILPRAATHSVNRNSRCCRNSQQTGRRNVRGFAAAATAGCRDPRRALVNEPKSQNMERPTSNFWTLRSSGGRRE